ncbi:hypothetical protein J6590_051671 [Homalodisca vitripennis]|nr:hypothetical protein J6590_051671 [Homalodisca vitripennis]
MLIKLTDNEYVTSDTQCAYHYTEHSLQSSAIVTRWVQWLSRDNRVKERRPWLLLGWVTAEQSCPCKGSGTITPPIRDAGEGEELIITKSSIKLTTPRCKIIGYSGRIEWWRAAYRVRNQGNNKPKPIKAINPYLKWPSLITRSQDET